MNTGKYNISPDTRFYSSPHLQLEYKVLKWIGLSVAGFDFARMNKSVLMFGGDRVGADGTGGAAVADGEAKSRHCQKRSAKTKTVLWERRSK
jgi:hypothetical protein